jgi:hypothetical protein
MGELLSDSQSQKQNGRARWVDKNAAADGVMETMEKASNPGEQSEKGRNQLPKRVYMGKQPKGILPYCPQWNITTSLK